MRDPIERLDTTALIDVLSRHWSDQQIMELLDSPLCDARKLAALALGFVGDRRCVTALANCLKDSDAIVNQMAEHALWTVWFRSGSHEAQEALQRGAELLDGKQYGRAEACFGEAIAFDPTYAEAFNQRSLAGYLLENYAHAADDGEMVIRLMPCHFGAWAGLGHCYAHLGATPRAMECYHHALAINPYLHGIRQIVSEIQRGHSVAHPAIRL